MFNIFTRSDGEYISAGAYPAAQTLNLHYKGHFGKSIQLCRENQKILQTLLGETADPEWKSRLKKNPKGSSTWEHEGGAHSN
jgi:hypothetical protein